MELTALLVSAALFARGLSSPVATLDGQQRWYPDPDPTPVSGCTATVTESVQNPCSRLAGARTAYPLTITSPRPVDCHGCPHISVAKAIYYCPMQTAPVAPYSTATASTPLTAWNTVCAVSSSPSASITPSDDGTESPTAAATATSTPTATRGAPGRGSSPTASASASTAPPPCPTTFVVQPDRSAGSTYTEFQQWETATARLDCKGCPLVVSTALAGYGPAGRFKDTTTVPMGTTTVYTCRW